MIIASVNANQVKRGSSSINNRSDWKLSDRSERVRRLSACDRVRARSINDFVSAKCKTANEDDARGWGRTRRRVRSYSSSNSTNSNGNNNAANREEELKQWFKSLKKQPLDTLPKPWKSFFGMRAAGVVLNVDNEKQTVAADEIDAPTLSMPRTRDEARERLKCNLVYYRQNYLAMYLPFALVFGGFSFLPFLFSCVGIFVGAAARSDKILGEVQYKVQDRVSFQFNSKVCAGVDRKLLSKLGFAFALFWATKWVYFSEYYLIASVSKLVKMIIRVTIYWMITSAYLAILRPIDLKSALGNAWGELKDAKSREDFQEAGKKAIQGMKGWFNQTREAPVSTPIIVNVKGDTTKEASNPFDNWKKGATDASARDASRKGINPPRE